MGNMKILKAGLSSTIQDQGRPGYQSKGISVSGAMDKIAAKLSNLLVGNPPDEACLEMTLQGDTIAFSKDTVIAICGGDFGFKINGSPVDINCTIPVIRGDILTSDYSKSGFRAYLAVRGGLRTRKILSSRSTSTRESLGHFGGRKLRNLDEIPYTHSSSPIVPRKLSGDILKTVYRPRPIRFTYGRESERFSELSKGVFTESDYKISQDSDRMGYRLEGGFLHAPGGHDIISGAVNFGSIQVPASGQPIIMMADCQTVGGYAKMGQVIQADLPYLAQCRPGESLRFEAVSVEEAISQWRDLHEKISAWTKGLMWSQTCFEDQGASSRYYEVRIKGTLYNIRVSEK